jgi:hypothetical protein
MKRYHVKILQLFILIFLLSCKKESKKRYCWQGFQPSGGDIPGLLLCDKTEAEIQEMYPQYWFYKEGEKKYCWHVQTQQRGTFYMRHIPESIVDKMKPLGGYNYTKVDCSSFCVWTWHEKHQSKITGLYNPTREKTETYAADSCSKLFLGRKITIRETADSIIYREFIEQYNR